MALPTIIINSATGSDTAASGAGPATALTGTLAVPTTTTVVISDTVDLSGVATDGSAVLYLADAVAGDRDFDNITGVSGGPSGSPWTVTVANGFTTSVSSFSWAIGGSRASIGSATSSKLFSNNSAAGDAMPGWTVQLASGHAETLSATLTMRRAGDQTNGAITFQGAPNAATLPVLTFSNNGTAIQMNPSPGFQVVQNFALKNSNATKTASIGINMNGQQSFVKGMKIADGTNNFWKPIALTNSGQTVRGCELAYGTAAGITVGGNILAATVLNNYIHNNAVNGITLTAGDIIFIWGNIIAGNTGDGINYPNTSGTAGRFITVLNNTFDSNTANGVNITGISAEGANSTISNNIFSNNGAYGINFSNGSVTAAYLSGILLNIEGNDFYNNTSGKYNPSYVPSLDEQTLNPSYNNAGSGDYSVTNASLKGTGWPVGGSQYVGGTSTTYSYGTAGAAQPNPSGGGAAGMLYTPGMQGGMEG